MLVFFAAISLGIPEGIAIMTFDYQLNMFSCRLRFF